MTEPARGRGRRHPCVALSLVLSSFLGPLAVAQDEPETPQAETKAPEKAEPVTVLKVGTIHTMTGSTIQDGVIVIRGARIEAVGPAASTAIPEGATVFEHPSAHAYPGLIDALSQAFAPRGGDGIGDAGGELALALDRADEPSGELVQDGVTTAYVSSRSGAVWRGKGALLHLGAGGPEAFPGHATVAVHLRLSNGNAPMHPLARMEQLAALGREFEQLKDYEKAFGEYEKQLKDYETKFGEYLDWHRKKNGIAAPTEGAPAANPAEGQGARPEGAPGRSGRRPRGDGSGRGGPGGGPGGPGGGPGGNAPPQGGQPAPGNPTPAAPAQGNPAEGAAPKPEEKAPERPKFPPPPPHDAAKDALIEVRDGKLALFVEVDRREEVERALQIARDYGVKRLVLELADRAGDAASAIADAGVPVLVTGAESPAPEAEEDAGNLPIPVAVALAHKNVPIAIGSASVARARNLPAVAAEAVGNGVPAETALRAITVDAAAMLGISSDCGTLEAGKLADVLITSAPLLQSDARILRVLSGGRTAHEAK